MAILEKSRMTLVIILLIQILSCTNDKNKIEILKNEIIKVEKDFSDMAQKDGAANAFTFYAADSAVIMRQNKIYKGKDKISNWFNKNTGSWVSLTWEPMFVDISQSNDMAYTYGEYVLVYRDTIGNLHENKGIFHTVWKRQANGTWKFVYD